MIDGLKPYPAMKDSGVPWLGNVPEHWRVRRLKSAFDRIVGGSTPSSAEATYWDGDIVWVTPADVSKSSRLKDSQRRITSDGLSACSAELVPSGSIIVTSRAPVGNVAIADVELCTNQGCKALVPAPGIVDPTFGFQVLTILKGELQSLATGTTFTEISTTRLGDIPIPLPPLPEQAAIVRFLDHADRRIRRYIRAKQKLIKLLEEQKQAIIHRAVTRGLDPNVRLKPSGVEWLGDVPEHWRVTALRRCWSVTDCKHLTVPFVEDDEAFPLASVREVQSFELSLANAKRTTREHYESLIAGGRKPRAGDLIYCRNVSVGAAAIVTTDQPLAMGQDVCLIRSSGENQRYLNYFLRSPVMRHQLATLLVGSTFNRINVADIKALLIIVPPRAEQDAIAEHLDNELAEAVRAQALAEAEISLLREYRTRLIADVVTGKLDVRKAAARLPDEAEEPEPPDEIEAEGDADEAGADDTAEVPEEAEA